MKNAIILTAYGQSPDDFWYPYVKQGLEEKGYKVWLEQIPDYEVPKLEVNLPYVQKELKTWGVGDETILIGHSVGVPLALSFLQGLEGKIKQGIFVAGFVSPLGPPEPNGILQKQYDWEKIKQSCDEFVFIHSDNDPWGCGEEQGKVMFENLGGTLVIKHDEGHFGTTVHNQPYKEFPFLLSLID